MSCPVVFPQSLSQYVVFFTGAAALLPAPIPLHPPPPAPFACPSCALANKMATPPPTPIHSGKRRTNDKISHVAPEEWPYAIDVLKLRLMEGESRNVILQTQIKLSRGTAASGFVATVS